MESKSLEFDKWIQYAEDHHLLLTENDFKKLTIGVPYDIVQIDYLRFLAIEYGDRFNIKFNKNYDPMDLYRRIKETIVPDGSFFIKKSPVMAKDCCTANWEDVKWYGAIVVPYDSNQSYELGFYKTQDSQWLASGSGDGYSRYILWKNLKKLPKVYINQP